MADKKISALTAATTPLAGTEVLPIVQSGATVKATVANIVGAGTSPGSFTSITGTQASSITYADSAYGAGLTVTNSSNTAASQAKVYVVNNAGDYFSLGRNSAALGSSSVLFSTGAYPIDFYTNTNYVASFTSAGNLSLANGNLVIATSGKGIDFSATAGTGTSELLADYEEGTWTPTITAAIGSYTTVTSQAGTYTKVGRQVTLNWYFVVTNKGTGLGSVNISNLPFASNASAGNFYAGSGYDTSQGIAQITSMTATTSIDVLKYDGTDPIIITRGQVGQITYFV